MVQRETLYSKVVRHCGQQSSEHLSQEPCTCACENMCMCMRMRRNACIPSNIYLRVIIYMRRDRNGNQRVGADIKRDAGHAVLRAGTCAVVPSGDLQGPGPYWTVLR